MRLAETFGKNMCLMHIFPLLQNQIYTDLHPTSLGQFLRAIWGAVSLAAVLILPQIKLYSQLSHCAFFFFQSTRPSDGLKVNLNTQLFKRSRILSVTKLFFFLKNKIYFDYHTHSHHIRGGSTAQHGAGKDWHHLGEPHHSPSSLKSLSSQGY